MSALTFNKLEDAYILTYENAKELLEEAKILFEHKRYARAYYLAQISYEESGKLPIIFQEATRSFYKETHDWKSFYKRLRSHEDKNRMSLMLEFQLTFPDHVKEYSTEERTEMLNKLKNGSLYTDLDGKEYCKPSNEIDKSIAEGRIKVAEMHINFTSKGNFHIKGNIEKNLSTEAAKNNRKWLRDEGLI